MRRIVQDVRCNAPGNAPPHAYFAWYFFPAKAPEELLYYDLSIADELMYRHPPAKRL